MLSSMSQGSVCTECGSDSLVASGVLEHGTWIQKLTCWTCNECRSIVIVPDEQDILVGDH